MRFLHKKFISYFISIFIICSIVIGVSCVTTESIAFANETTLEQVASLPSQIDNKVSIGFVGDIAPGINASDDILSGVIPYTEKPDIMIGNFEGVVAKNTYSKCGKSSSKNCFSFNGDENFLKLLSLASFDVLNVANNHFNDYGQVGQEETIKNMEKTGIVASGIKDKITYITKNNIKMGIVGFATNSWTTNLNNNKAVEKIVNEANQNADLVIVIFHGGGEGEKYVHVPVGMEKYIGENRGDLRNFSHISIDAGADIVLGSGPHVLRGIEKYKGKIIAYSLGNFASANKLSTAGLNKTSAMIEATLKKDGSFVSGAIFPFEISRQKITIPDLNKTAISVINNLSKSDFGEQGITLSSSGEIVFK